MVDIVFVVDESGSVTEERFELLKKFIKSIVKRSLIAPDQVQIGLVTFASARTLRWKLNTYKSTGEVVQAVQALKKTDQEDSGTYTHLALNTAKDLLFGKSHGGRNGALKMVILITDGPSKYEDKTRASVAVLRKYKVTIAAVGIDNYDRYEIRHIASDPYEDYAFMVDSYKDLTPIAKKVAAVTCAGYNAYTNCPAGGMDRCCPDDQVSFEGSCYFFGSLLLNDFRTANKACKAMGAELVTVDSYQEDEFLVQQLQKIYTVDKVYTATYYTGYHYDGGKWTWISGEEPEYNSNRWYSTYPYAVASYGECMYMHHSYAPWKWLQAKCGTKAGFICES